MTFGIDISRDKRILWTMLLIITFSCGCEDVVDLNLSTTAPRLVIEGKLSNIYSQNYFLISRTTDFYSPSSVEFVSGATVVVSDDAGYTDTLVEKSAGEYRPTRYYYKALYGRTYYATVTVDGNTYTASTKMQFPIRIKSLRFDCNTKTDDDDNVTVECDLIVDFQDHKNRPDYARIKIDSNGVAHKGFYLYDGRFSDGNWIGYDRFNIHFSPDDTVTVELHTMDRTMYYYFLTLWEVWASEGGDYFFDVSPGNPNTNWSGGALGYFGAFSIDTKRNRPW